MHMAVLSLFTKIPHGKKKLGGMVGWSCRINRIMEASLMDKGLRPPKIYSISQIAMHVVIEEDQESTKNGIRRLLDKRGIGNIDRRISSLHV